MFAFIGWYINLLTAIVGWSSFLLVSLTGIALLLGKKRKILGSICVGYGVAFLIVRIFFSALYARWMPVIAILLVIVSTAWARYEDRVKGKRWWR